jgi:hypothetical protein
MAKKETKQEEGTAKKNQRVNLAKSIKQLSGKAFATLSKEEKDSLLFVCASMLGVINDKGKIVR